MNYRYLIPKNLEESVPFTLMKKHILPQATSLMRLGIPILGKQLLTIVGA